MRKLWQTANGVESAKEMPVQAPLSAANKAASTTAQRGINATKRVREQLAGKRRVHEVADGAPIERLEVPSAHCVKQHHNRGHFGQRHLARPAAATALVAALVKQLLLKQRLKLLAEVVNRAKQIRGLVHGMEHLICFGCLHFSANHLLLCHCTEAPLIQNSGYLYFYRHEFEI